MRIDIDGAGVEFGGVVALSPVSFSIDSGEIVAVMGPSGSGKSTLLGCVGGLVTPTTGQVRIHPAGIPTDRPDWIFQSSPMLLRRTAVDNIVLGAIARGIPLREAILDARLQLSALKLLDRANAAVFSLSGGERQRVAIARSMVSKAPAILADEPTASLDVRARDLVIQALHQAAANGAAVLVATHDEYVARSCDRVTYLSHVPTEWTQ